MSGALSVPVLSLQGIVKTFPGVRALDHVDFDLYPGEVHALLGENGAGKSTLIKVVAGVYAPDEGTMAVDGRPVRLASPSDALRLGVKVVYQELDLAPNLSVAENVFLGDYPRKRFGLVDWAALREQTVEALAAVGLQVDPWMPVGFLTVAQQQLVEIARAVSRQMRILILDEPTSALSPAEAEKLFQVIERLKARGVGIVYVSHKLDEIFRIADRVTVLRDGRRVLTKAVVEMTSQQLIASMVGRELTDLFPKSPGSPGAVVLDVRGLSTPRTLRNVSLRVRAGEVVGVFGLMGAGLEALGRAIFGLDPSSTGEVFVGGQRLRPHDPSDAVTKGLGFLTENRKEDGLVLAQSVRFNMSLASLAAFARGGWIDRRRERSAVERFVERLSVRTPSLDQKVVFLSGGNQQKVLMARWMMKSLKALMLGEPTRGIDVGAKAEIHRLIDQMAREGLGVLIFSSEMQEVLGVSDRILVMHEGAITGEFSREEATQELLMAHAVGEVKAHVRGGS
ncbi:MAG TPA: sugar ABC transporter ATP-binding protein [Chloroflexota bacterium]